MDFTLQLVETITNNFSEDQKVGSGGYGDVYRAVYNGEPIAVKKLHSLQGLDDKEFHNEFLNLTKVRHEHLVRLVGYCSEVGHKRVEQNVELVPAETVERVLCYEYMEDGSLDKHITDDSCQINWSRCYEIIKGICKGLNHLHTAEEKPIFHLDLKPANILLDGRSMTPKIADLGSSKLILSTKAHQLEMLTRTQGYMPPEYLESGYISEKFDVFSLGVIIIKMLAGNKGYSLFSELPRKQFAELVEEKWNKRSTLSTECIRDVRISVEVAIRCVDADFEKRPSIQEIIHGLEALQAKIESVYHFPYNHRQYFFAQLDPSEYFIRCDCKSGLDTAHDQSTDLFLQAGSKPHHLPLQHLKDITNNFCDERILGRGGFGVVYKGVLQNGEMVAVKKLVQAMPTSQEQFENEVNLLMNLEHPNIVRLVGYCYETQHLHMPHEGKFVFAWNTESLLCLECLPNGSLDKYISDASSGLDWPTRCKIIEGISFGLLYLHEQSNEPIIHLDLKPSNILLDGNMVPKITDFGLSRLFDQKQTICTAVTNGTLGYMPPEYLRGIITPMSDIFSLGVIIMEVITGHRDYPYDIRTSSEEFIQLELNKWKIMLQKEPGYESLETDCQKIERCIQIGLLCVNPERTKRPTAKKVVDMLQGLESMKWYIINEVTSPANQI